MEEKQGANRPQSGLVHIGETLDGLGLRPTKNMSEASPPQPPGAEEYSCPRCQDFHWVHPHVGGKVDYSQVVPCECVGEKLAKERAERLLKFCELPPGTGHMTFENWKHREELGDAYEASLALAEGRSTVNWLTFLGLGDRGKTHLLIAICRRWLARGVLARYAYVPLLLEELRAGFRNEEDHSYEGRFNFFLNVPLLALDDLGTEHFTSWVQERLDTIVDYRLMHGLALVVNTNLPWEELSFRIASRLQRGGRVIYINSPEFSSWGKGRGAASNE